MQITIDPHSSIPIYKQISHYIEQQVSDGILNPGDKLPTFREMSSDLEVSLGTVKSAYDDLLHSGTINMTQGRGSFISNKKVNNPLGKKDTAIKIIDNALNQLLSIPISTQEARIYIDLKLREIEHTKTTLNVALIDCNIEALLMIEDRISDIDKIDTTVYLLDSFLKTDIQNLNDVDLFVTTFTHYDEIKEKIGNDNKLMGIVISASLETMLQLSRIRKEESVATITSSKIFANIINKQYRKYIDKTKILSSYFLDDNIDPDYIIHNYNKVILPKSFYRIANPKQTEIIGHIQDAGVKLVYYDYDTDQGSFTYLKEKIDRIYQVVVAKTI